MIKPSDPIRNRTHDLPACNTVTQPTAPPHTPHSYIVRFNASCDVRSVFKLFVFEITSSVGTKFMRFKTRFEKVNQESEPTLIKRNTLKYMATNVYSSIIVLNMR